MKKRTLKTITLSLLVALLVSVFPAEFSFAAVPDTISQPAEATSFKSTENFDQEYLRAYVTQADDRVLKVIYRTPLETSLFRLSLYRVGENKGDIDLDLFIQPKIQYASDGTPTYNFTYYINMEGLEIPNGKYTIYIRRCETEIDAANLKYTGSGVLNKNMVIQVTNGKVKILRYTDVINYNREIMAIGENYDTSLYLDPSLEDIRFVLRDPVTGIYDTMSRHKTSYISEISDFVCRDADTDYEKLRKIYEYAASNFYYDTIAFQTHSNQYANPYDNIYNFEHGAYSANSQAGRVYTTCQGYSAIVIALARAQGIPSRLVYGHRAAVPSNDWITENNINVRDHWWVEAWVDGRWIFIDPTVGTTNKYNSETGKFSYYGLTNYTYFDPTEEQIATSHLYFNIYPDYRYGYYIDNPYEMDMLTEFLDSWSDIYPDEYEYYYEIYADQVQNGELMNEDYASYDTKTWGDGKKTHFMTDGRGNVSQIQWSDYGFTGALNLPDFKHMKVLSSHGNLFETVDLSGCTALEKVYLYSNRITSIDLSDCRSAWYIRCKNNPMKEATVYTNGRNRTFTAGDNGTFYFTIDTRYLDSEFSLYSRPDTGYKVEGIYSTATGAKLSTKKTWHFEPKASGYEIVFALDPDSFKYTLNPGDSGERQEHKAEYITAAAKRLEELGYYEPSYWNDPLLYSDSMEEAAVKFQVMHNLENNGIIDEDTWSVLFSYDALEMVDEYEYRQILDEYEAMKELRAETELFMSEISVQAASEASSGAMKITWTASLPEDADEEYSIDGFEVWKSTSKTSGYKMMRDTENAEKFSYKNTAGLKKGTRYYYKVRAYKLIGEEKIYSDWSNVTYKKAK